jgi:hypothetical protein
MSKCIHYFGALCIITVGQLLYLFEPDVVRHQQIRRSCSLFLPDLPHFDSLRAQHPCLWRQPVRTKVAAHCQHLTFLSPLQLSSKHPTAKHITFHPTFTPSLHIHYPTPRVLSQPLQTRRVANIQRFGTNILPSVPVELKCINVRRNTTVF